MERSISRRDCSVILLKPVLPVARTRRSPSPLIFPGLTGHEMIYLLRGSAPKALRRLAAKLARPFRFGGSVIGQWTLTAVGRPYAPATALVLPEATTTMLSYLMTAGETENVEVQN